LVLSAYSGLHKGVYFPEERYIRVENIIHFLDVMREETPEIVDEYTRG
jgi:hypothetical protein